MPFATQRRLDKMPNLTLEEFYNMYGRPAERNSEQWKDKTDKEYEDYLFNIYNQYLARKEGKSPLSETKEQTEARWKRMTDVRHENIRQARDPWVFYKDFVDGKEQQETECNWNSNGEVVLDQWTGKPSTTTTTNEECFINRFWNPQTGEFDPDIGSKRAKDFYNADNREVSGWEQFKRGFFGSIKAFGQPLLDVVSFVPGVGQVASALSSAIDYLPQASNVYGGQKKKGYELHAVVVKKPMSKEEAIKHGESILKSKKFMRETSTSYRFRNIPKQKFESKTFRTKKVNPQISVIFGKLK
jgi:hypothetical protein